MRGKEKGASFMSGTTDAHSSLVVAGVKIETIDRGRGQPILFLHPHIGIEPSAPVLDALAKGGRVIAPTYPGFGASQLPPGMNEHRRPVLFLSRPDASV